MPSPTQPPYVNDPADRSPTDALADTDRRAALAKLGALAAWTAPAMLTLTLTPRTSAASEGMPGFPNF